MNEYRHFLKMYVKNRGHELKSKAEYWGNKCKFGLSPLGKISGAYIIQTGLSASTE